MKIRIILDFCLYTVFQSFCSILLSIRFWSNCTELSLASFDGYSNADGNGTSPNGGRGGIIPAMVLGLMIGVGMYAAGEVWSKIVK